MCGSMHQLTFVCVNVCVYVCVIHMWHDILQAFSHNMCCITIPIEQCECSNCYSVYVIYNF